MNLKCRNFHTSCLFLRSDTFKISRQNYPRKLCIDKAINNFLPYLYLTIGLHFNLRHQYATLSSAKGLFKIPIIKGYLHYKTITSDVSSEAQVKKFFLLIRKDMFYSQNIHIFYFWPSHDLANLWHHDEY